MNNKLNDDLCNVCDSDGLHCNYCSTRKQALNELADIMEKHGVSLDLEIRWDGGFDLDLLIKGEYNITLLDECLGRELTPEVLRNLANQQEDEDR